MAFNSSKVLDVVRMDFVCATLEAIRAVLDALDESVGLTVLRIKNRMHVAANPPAVGFHGDLLAGDALSTNFRPNPSKN